MLHVSPLVATTVERKVTPPAVRSSSSRVILLCVYNYSDYDFCYLAMSIMPVSYTVSWLAIEWLAKLGGSTEAGCLTD